MTVLITGASSGLGKDFVYELSKQGHNLILVARDKEKLEKIKKELNTNVEILQMDLSVEKNLYKLFDKYQGKIDFLINNAGFGACGKFTELDLDNELNMIDLNIKAYHILTKLFLQDFKKKNKGIILNVASSAAFQPGPLMATYYATKSYVYNLTMAIYEELRREKSNIKIHVLCPGPVKTHFNDRAKVDFAIKGLESDKVVKYTLKKISQNKTIIIVGLLMKIGTFLNRLAPRKIVLKIIYNIQKRKTITKKTS